MDHIKGFELKGTGRSLPERIVTNKELEEIADTSDKWIFETLGIRERRVAMPGQKPSDFASEAALIAIKDAELIPLDIDLIIVATATPDRLAPSTACIVQERIGALNAVCFDIAAVCSGFLFATRVGLGFLNVYENILIIGVDMFSTVTAWGRRDCVFFGDGAGAAVLSRGKGEAYYRLYSDGRGKDGFTIPGGGAENPEGDRFFKMNGRAVFDTGTRVLGQAIRDVLRDAQLSIDDIDYMIPHQPGIGMLRKVAEDIGLPFDKVMTNMDKYANTSGGTIPILLDEVRREKNLSEKKLLFAAVGSGWTWGASIWT